MEIPAALQTLLQTSQADNLGLLKLLKPGMLLHAKVSGGTLAGIARLQIGVNELQARTQLPLKTGDTLALRVEKGLPLPELKILQPSTQSPIDTLLKHALSRQLPANTVQQGLRQLAQLLRQPPTTPSPAGSSNIQAHNQTAPQTQPAAAHLPASPTPQPTTPTHTATHPAQQVLKVLLPTPPDTAPKGAHQVKQAFEQSGLFFEHTLFNSGHPTSNDRKFQLLQLLRLFTPQARAQQKLDIPQNPDSNNQRLSGDQLMNRLLRLVEGSLGRIQHHQVASLPDDGGKQVWHFELPVQLGERKQELKLRIQREATSTDEETAIGAIWKVDIAFEFEALGQINAQVAMRDTQFSVAFWSQNATTAQRIDLMANTLAKQFQHAGLTLDTITSAVGEPPDASPKPQTRLLDERA